MKAKLKELTSRSNGMGYAKRKQKLVEYIRGWVGYFHLANMKRLLMDTDSWLRRRIRMCIWKSWKLPKTRIKTLSDVALMSMMPEDGVMLKDIGKLVALQ